MNVYECEWESAVVAHKEKEKREDKANKVHKWSNTRVASW